jgi:hypothetical protein
MLIQRLVQGKIVVDAYCLGSAQTGILRAFSKPVALLPTDATVDELGFSGQQPAIKSAEPDTRVSVYRMSASAK